MMLIGPVIDDINARLFWLIFGAPSPMEFDGVEWPSRKLSIGISHKAWLILKLARPRLEN